MQPNIVTVHDVASKDGVDFLVMEYVPGRTLREVIRSKGLPVATALTIATAIVDAMSAAHQAGILHRDLKPANIMVSDAGRVKLLDFGLAAPIDHRRSAGAPGEFGTSTYMAPEQLEHRSVSPRSDIFSFGLVLFEMLTGHHAFGAGPAKDVAQAIVKDSFVGRFPKRVPEGVAKVVERCLEKNPKHRFHSMQDVRAVLKVYETPLAAPQQPPSVRPAVTETRRLKAALKRFGYESFIRSRESFEEIAALLEASDTPSLRNAVITSMQDVLFTVRRIPTLSGSPVRGVRRLAVALMKLATSGNLRQAVQRTQLEFLDLYGMDFTNEDFSGYSFNGAFLVEADFQGANLTGAAFEECCIRNVNLTGARVAATDFTDADWFNASGWTVEQLQTFTRR